MGVCAFKRQSPGAPWEIGAGLGGRLGARYGRKYANEEDHTQWHTASILIFEISNLKFEISHLVGQAFLPVVCRKGISPDISLTIRSD
jgi:hypothetical protein